MTSTKLLSRKYKDGIMNRHENDEFIIETAPVYTMFRHEVEIWDNHSLPTIYTVVCSYCNGDVNCFTFDKISDCLRVFRLLVAMD